MFSFIAITIYEINIFLDYLVLEIVYFRYLFVNPFSVSAPINYLNALQDKSKVP